MKAVVIAIGLSCCVVMHSAFAQSFASRPVRIIVPIPPGPSADLLARLLAPKLSASLGQPVVVENHSGAAGVIGADMVARSVPDGHTMLIASTSQMVTAPLLSRSTPYDPVKDFTPITMAVEAFTLLVMNPKLPIASFQELIDYARKNPGRLNYGSAGVGSFFHLVGEAMNIAAGTRMTHVPYKGVVQSQNDVVSGVIELSFAAVASSTPFVKAGKLKVIAIVEKSRYKGYPDVQTIAEVVPGFRKPPAWFSFFGPAGLPRPIVDRSHAEIVKALRTPDIEKWLDANSLQLIASTPDELGADLRSALSLYASVIKAAGIKAE
jgi:tripartite-type tricarboxylate transporter receptor subunit TctC